MNCPPQLSFNGNGKWRSKVTALNTVSLLSQNELGSHFLGGPLMDKTMNVASYESDLDPSNDDTDRRDTDLIKLVLTFQAVFLDLTILCLVPWGLLEKDII